MPSLAFLLAAGSEAARLPLLMFVVFVSAKLMAELFEKLGQPGIVGGILAGILVGPHVLGWVAPNEFLAALSELGVMFLLFKVGLEVRSSELFRVGGTALLAATAGVIVPFFLGWAILRAWGEPQIEAVFVGAAMVATSVGITAQVLASKKLLAARASKIILAAAVIDDVLGLLILAAVSGMARGSVNVTELAISAALAVGFTAIVATLGTRAMHRVVPRIEEKLSAAEGQFSLAIGLLFGLSVLAIYAGVAAIIGAFLAGMALAETVGHRVHDLTTGVAELLVPFFLVGIGLHFDLGVFTDMPVLTLAGVILVAAVLSKLIGCGLGAIGLGWSDAVRVGVGMVPRGEVGMVVAQIGLGFGVIKPSIYSVVVFMALATTLVAPPLLKLAYRGVEPDTTAAEEQMRIG
jgi:Kef-type K+ transport system membrane component KefB